MSFSFQQIPFKLGNVTNLKAFFPVMSTCKGLLKTRQGLLKLNGILR